MTSAVDFMVFCGRLLVVLSNTLKNF